MLRRQATAQEATTAELPRFPATATAAAISDERPLWQDQAERKVTPFLIPWRHRSRFRLRGLSHYRVEAAWHRRLFERARETLLRSHGTDTLYTDNKYFNSLL